MHIVERIGEDGIQPFVYFLIAPVVALVILYPFKIGDHNTASTGQDIGYNEYAAFRKDFRRLSRSWVR